MPRSHRNHGWVQIETLDRLTAPHHVAPSHCPSLPQHGPALVAQGLSDVKNRRVLDFIRLVHAAKVGARRTPNMSVVSTDVARDSLVQPSIGEVLAILIPSGFLIAAVAT